MTFLSPLQRSQPTERRRRSLLPGTFIILSFGLLTACEPLGTCYQSCPPDYGLGSVIEYDTTEDQCWDLEDDYESCTVKWRAY